MQTTARKVAAVFVAAMLAFAMAFVATPTKAYAAGTGTLVVESSKAEFNGKTVKAWKMFNAAANADGSGATYTLADEWKPFFVSLSMAEDGTLSQKAYEYVAAMQSDSAAANSFALKASDWATKNIQNGTASAVVQEQPGTGKYQATFAGLEYGYYLVVPIDVQVDPNAILVNVVSDSKTVSFKSVFPTVDKTVADVNGGKPNVGGAAIGDVLTFTLTSKVPDLTDYTEYVFKFIDTLSAGLTLQDGSGDVTPPVDPLKSGITVQIGQTTLQTQDFSAKAEVDSDKTKLTIDLGAYLIANKGTLQTGDPITVTYKAKLNDKAIVDNDDTGNTNEVKVQYSTDPQNPQDGTEISTPDKTHTYTFKFGIDKQDGGDKPLAGAEFKIWKDGTDGAFGNDDTALRFDDKQNGKYVLNANGAVETITTTDTGKFNVEGLEEGTYWVEEVNPPAGYNKLDKPMKVVITAEYNDDGTLKSHSVKYDDALDKEAAHGDHYVTIVNKAGTLLPETGGMGTIAFTVIGALVIVGGVVWAVRRKRNVR